MVKVVCLVKGVVDEEVEKVLFEVTKGKLDSLSVNTASLPAGAAAAVDLGSDEEAEPLEAMTRRLDALRST